MAALTFDEPVEILVGLGFPTAIRSVFMAHHIVTEWPTTSRGPSHAAALNACRMALNGIGDVAAAREAFIAFARSAGILVEDTAPVVAATAIGRGMAAKTA